ncbi:MAG TPA: isoaspartyl peptidase/L-asparaginase [Bacteriovoracaceae bacterium]|nr:isoaspartyl peptidase/L-asparaginase [Bacteriovoracaceae bacterium]
MMKIFSLLALLGFMSCSTRPEKKHPPLSAKAKFAFMIHGGAGVAPKGSQTPEQEKAYTEKLTEALLSGHKILQGGGSSLDAVESAIRILEDSPLFNAGKGAVFTADGKNELDASIMSGSGLEAGAVAGLHHVKNPITLARAVMENSPHVMMVGEGAEKFAKEQNIELVPAKYFWTKPRWDILQEMIKVEKAKDKSGMNSLRATPANRFGTVGAVALDSKGNLAAGTSTGGMTFKKFGRVGDSPIIGAGTYAKNKVCAVSATGHGEYFIRLSVARDICALVEYKGLGLQAATDEVVLTKLKALGGDGGVIAIDADGGRAITFSSEGMYRAWIDETGQPQVRMY